MMRHSPRMLTPGETGKQSLAHSRLRREDFPCEADGRDDDWVVEVFQSFGGDGVNDEAFGVSPRYPSMHEKGYLSSSETMPNILGRG